MHRELTKGLQKKHPACSWRIEPFSLFVFNIDIPNMYAFGLVIQQWPNMGVGNVINGTLSNVGVNTLFFFRGFRIVGHLKFKWKQKTYILQII